MSAQRTNHTVQRIERNARSLTANVGQKMKKVFYLVATAVLFGFGAYLFLCGYENFRLWNASQGSSDHEIFLDRKGIFSITVNPPGRSFFKPGVRMWIILTGKGAEDWRLGRSLDDGEGTVTVTTKDGHVLLKENISDFGSGTSTSIDHFLACPREFTSFPGEPYLITFDVLRPYMSLSEVTQTLSVFHFVSGNEILLHFIQFLFGLISFGLGVLLIYLVYARVRPQLDKPEEELTMPSSESSETLDR